MALQLYAISLDTTLHVVKQTIRLNTQFFYSMFLQPPASIDELFQRGNQYAMLNDDVVTMTKRTVANTSDSRNYIWGGKGKRSRNDHDGRGKRDPGAYHKT